MLKTAGRPETWAIFSSPHFGAPEKQLIVAGFPAQAKTLENLVDGFGRNDLQPAAVAISEVLDAIRKLDANFGNARMTGSGAAVFARLSGGRDGVRRTVLGDLAAGTSCRMDRTNLPQSGSAPFAELGRLKISFRWQRGL